MNINIELDDEVVVDDRFDFDYKQAITNAIIEAHRYCKCPYDVEVNVMLTNNEAIHVINNETRDIDRPTDVLSFPMLEYENPGDFEDINEDLVELFNQDTGDLILGDIVLSVDKIREQAKEYGHSELREMSFLVIHSMLHLFGYDHMEEDGDIMEITQKSILEDMNILRD
jgi:probable rRNA maturation factor